jgi:hypothetical protein
MAFTTLRGRPRKPVHSHDVDLGTPELRLKHALRFTTEPIDLCLEKRLISKDHHWCGLHLRWLYTLRYGAPNLTTYYGDRQSPASAPQNEDAAWRSMREKEYSDAITSLKSKQRYECVMRLTVYNERPSFLSSALCAQALQSRSLARELSHNHKQVCEGLEILTQLWRRSPAK